MSRILLCCEVVRLEQPTRMHHGQFCGGLSCTEISFSAPLVALVILGPSLGAKEGRGAGSCDAEASPPSQHLGQMVGRSGVSWGVHRPQIPLRLGVGSGASHSAHQTVRTRRTAHYALGTMCTVQVAQCTLHFTPCLPCCGGLLGHTVGAHRALCKKYAILDPFPPMVRVTAVTTAVPYIGLLRFLLSPKFR